MGEFLDPNQVSSGGGEPDLSGPDIPKADQAVSSQADSIVVPEPAGWTDALTGAEGPKYWDRLISGEQARLRRHRRPVTIVLLDLIGCEAQAARRGGEAALQSFARLSRTLVNQVRSSDHVTRVGRTRFALLLVETDELQALNFIDRLLGRVREAIDREGCDVRIGVGWASPAPGDRLAAAIALAEERLATDFFHTL
ncbi:MAG: diguanylate cyclase [Chloroflexi bacterium]|nr:diguanylate cyclase [Chloroflexota bacterium]